MIRTNEKCKQDGRLAPASFSPNYKYFDQLLQRVRNQTLVLNSVFEGFFTNINSATDFYTLCKEGVSRFLCLTVPKIFVGETFKVSEKIGTEKFYGWEGGGGTITIFRQKFSLSHYRKIRRGTLLCFRKFRVSKNVNDKRRGGCITIFLSKFFSHITEKIRRGTFLCFTKLRVSKIFMDKRRGVCITIFCQFICLTVPKKVVGNHFSISENFRYLNFFW